MAGQGVPVLDLCWVSLPARAAGVHSSQRRPRCATGDEADKDRYGSAQRKRQPATVDGGRGNDPKVVDGSGGQLEPANAKALQSGDVHQRAGLPSAERHDGEVVGIRAAARVGTRDRKEGQDLVGTAPTEHVALRGKGELEG